MKKTKIAAGISAVTIAGVAVYGLFRNVYRVPLKEYTRYALYMAVMDDEIGRNELEGMEFDGGKVKFPEKSESLQYRYHLFLELNRKKSREELRYEIREMERRLQTSRENSL